MRQPEQLAQEAGVIVAICPSRYDDLCDAFLRSMWKSQPDSMGSIVIADNGISEACRHYWSMRGVNFVAVDADPFRYAKAINQCAKLVAPADTLILGDDMKMITTRWLDRVSDFMANNPTWPRWYGALNICANDEADPGSIATSATAQGLGITIIPRRTWDAVGPWDERYDGGYGYEDVDYCVQIWHSGKHVGKTNALYVTHTGMETWKRKLGGYDKVIEACTRSHRLFYEKWGMVWTEEIKFPEAGPHLIGSCGCKR